MDREPSVTGEQPGGVHLTDKQVVFGVMAASMVVVVSFLCGVFVGRGVQAVRPAAIDSVAAAPGVAADAEAAAPLALPAGGGPAPPDRLGYPNRLTSPELARESLKPAPPPSPPLPPPETVAAEPAPARPPVGRGAGSTPAATTPRAEGGLTVQVAAVRRRAEAQAIVDRLVKKGFPAYVFTAPGGDRAGGFRVRVGSYKTRAEAEAMALRLTKEEQYKPWITR